MTNIAAARERRLKEWKERQEIREKKGKGKREIRRLRDQVLREERKRARNRRAPCVYGWYRSPRYLYVGSAREGIGRPLSANHHVLCNAKYNDQLHVWFFQSWEDTLSYERTFITSHQPQFNINGTKLIARLKIDQVIIEERPPDFGFTFGEGVLLFRQ